MNRKTYMKNIKAAVPFFISFPEQAQQTLIAEGRLPRNDEVDALYKSFNPSPETLRFASDILDLIKEHDIPIIFVKNIIAEKKGIRIQFMSLEEFPGDVQDFLVRHYMEFAISRGWIQPTTNEVGGGKTVFMIDFLDLVQ
ncbi:hypothetical protein [Paraburkholderia aromaticivorans]|uniref:hypothetical protein n=1 Tax=Paraburkholderia aromaticivorans TaxID=2026199 RepID=UPI0038BD081F